MQSLMPGLLTTFNRVPLERVVFKLANPVSRYNCRFFVKTGNDSVVAVVSPENDKSSWRRTDFRRSEIPSDSMVVIESTIQHANHTIGREE